MMVASCLAARVVLRVFLMTRLVLLRFWQLEMNGVLLLDSTRRVYEGKWTNRILSSLFFSLMVRIRPNERSSARTASLSRFSLAMSLNRIETVNFDGQNSLARWAVATPTANPPANPTVRINTITDDQTCRWVDDRTCRCVDGSNLRKKSSVESLVFSSAFLIK